MVKDGRKSEVVEDLSVLLTAHNKGFKPLTDHGVETPTVLPSKQVGNSAHIIKDKRSATSRLGTNRLGLTGKYSIPYKTCCLESEREVYELQ